MKWDQKIVSKTLKTLLVYAFPAWRMFKRQYILATAISFYSLEHFRNRLNKAQATMDFRFDVAKELLFHASNLILGGNKGSH